MIDYKHTDEVKLMGEMENKLDVGKMEEGNEGVDAERNQPDFRVVQPDSDQSGKKIFRPVGAMWKKVSGNGNSYYSLRIGELKLLVFPNDRK